MIDNALILISAIIILLAILFGLRRMFAKKPASIDSQVCPPTPTLASSGSGRPDELILGNLDDPLVRIMPSTAKAGGPTINIPSAIKDSLEPLMQRAPALFQSGRAMADSSLRVVFSKEVTGSLGSGGAKLVKDGAGAWLPVARNAKTGKFIETGRAVASGGVRMAQVAAMSWQIASIATAQHYLGEINEKLQKLENGLADVLFLLDQEKRSKLKAFVHQLRQYHDAIKRGDLCKDDFLTVRMRIEEMESECLAIAETGKAILERKRSEIDNIEIKDWADRAGSAARAKELIRDTSKAMQLVFLSHTCRILACQVRSAIPNGSAFVKDRLAHAVREVHATSQMLETGRVAFFDKIEGLKKREGDFFALGGIFDDDHQKPVSEEYRHALDQAIETATMVKNQAETATHFSADFDRMIESGIAIDVQIDNTGKVEVLAAGPA